MEDMPYYAGEGGGWKKRFEITIPILLLILVFFVVSWKLGWLAGVPVIGDWFKTGQVSIAIIGADPNIQTTIESFRTDMAINYEVFDSARLEDIRDANYFNKYNMIILTEGVNNDTMTLETWTFDQIKNFNNAGKPVIVLGNAAKLVKNDPAADGWTRLGFVPAVCRTGTNPCEKSLPATLSQIKLQIPDVNHAIVKDFTGAISGTDFTGTGGVAYMLVNPTSNGNPIMTLEDTTGATATIVPALIESTGAGLSGKVLYFSFDPWRYPPLLRKAIQYVS